MPRDGAITFADVISELDVLLVACAECGPQRSRGLVCL